MKVAVPQILLPQRYLNLLKMTLYSEHQITI